MRLTPHPLVTRDIDGIVDYILAVTGGNVASAARRLDEIDALIASILDNPQSGARLSGELDGWIARHGGRDHRITVVFRPDRHADRLLVALVAFGGRNWLAVAPSRRFDE
jgi:plasmid stabilization system protein ParE